MGGCGWVGGRCATALDHPLRPASSPSVPLSSRCCPYPRVTYSAALPYTRVPPLCLTVRLHTTCSLPVPVPQVLSGPTGHRRSVTGLEVLPSSGNLVSCSLDGQLLVWDYVAGTVIKRCAAHMRFECILQPG